MGDIINLKDARKQRARAEKEARAAANRARFGMSRFQRTLRDTERDRDRHILDLKRLTGDDPDKTPQR